MGTTAGPVYLVTSFDARRTRPHRTRSVLELSARLGRRGRLHLPSTRRSSSTWSPHADGRIRPTGTTPPLTTCPGALAHDFRRHAILMLGWCVSRCSSPTTRVARPERVDFQAADALSMADIIMTFPRRRGRGAQGGMPGSCPSPSPTSLARAWPRNPPCSRVTVTPSFDPAGQYQLSATVAPSRRTAAPRLDHGRRQPARQPLQAPVVDEAPSYVCCGQIPPGPWCVPMHKPGAACSPRGGPWRHRLLGQPRLACAVILTPASAASRISRGRGRCLGPVRRWSARRWVALPTSPRARSSRCDAPTWWRTPLRMRHTFEFFPAQRAVSTGPTTRRSPTSRSACVLPAPERAGDSCERPQREASADRPSRHSLSPRTPLRAGFRRRPRRKAPGRPGAAALLLPDGALVPTTPAR